MHDRSIIQALALKMEAAIEALIGNIDAVEGDALRVGDSLFALMKELKASTVIVEDGENKHTINSFLVGRLLVAMRQGLVKFNTQLRASILRAMRYVVVSELHVKTIIEYRLDVFIVMGLEREQVRAEVLSFGWGGGGGHGLFRCRGQINQTRYDTDAHGRGVKYLSTIIPSPFFLVSSPPNLV